MPEAPKTLQLADEVVRRLASAVRSTQMYAVTHPLVARNVAAFADVVSQAHQSAASLAVGFLADEIVVGDVPLPKPGQSLLDFGRRLRGRGIERVLFEPGVTADEIGALVVHMAGTSQPDSKTPAVPEFTHIRVGRISVEKRVEATLADIATIRRLYADAVTAVESIWDEVRRDGKIDTKSAQAIVHGLAQAVAQNASTLLALTTLKNYDNYTFTHMVNVSILTMAQARTLGVDGPLLREFGLAALMHDIGKVRTPTAILRKPEQLTDEELQIIRRHPIDGTEMLRRTPDMPPLVPLVAFEHHLRLDGSGYPAGVSRPTLNVATLLTSMSDVFDAMRSQRVYQQMFPSERVIEVLRRSDGRQFDQHLVRRFVQLLGIYPPGTAVRLDTGEIAVVLRANASDTHRPRVRVVLSDRCEPLGRPRTVDLWAATPGNGEPTAIAAPIDPDVLGLDPLAYL